MISLLTSVAPIALGFVGKLFAMKQHAAADQQKLMIQAMSSSESILLTKARDLAAKDKSSCNEQKNNYPGNPWFISAIQFAPLAGLDTVMPTIKKAFQF